MIGKNSRSTQLKGHYESLRHVDVGDAAYPGSGLLSLSLKSMAWYVYHSSLLTPQHAPARSRSCGATGQPERDRRIVDRLTDAAARSTNVASPPTTGTRMCDIDVL